MEYKDPVFELLSSLEHIVFKDDNQKLTSNRKSTVFSEFEQLRKGTGLKIDDFANVMGVSVAMVRERRHGKRVGVETGQTVSHRAEIDAPDSGQSTAFTTITRLISRAAAKASKGAFAAAP
ncbi:transcriptional regulator [Klebsiella pneumoniae]|nr:transcriptional regulator [Klebsiella pneumoniae]